MAQGLAAGGLEAPGLTAESWLIVLLPLIAMDAVSLLLSVLVRTLSIYSLILLVRVLLSWFPNLDWSNPVLSTVSSITDPYLNAFRGLIPPLGGLDLSAIVAFLALNLAQQLLGSLSMSLVGSGYGA